MAVRNAVGDHGQLAASNVQGYSALEPSHNEVDSIVRVVRPLQRHSPWNPEFDRQETISKRATIREMKSFRHYADHRVRLAIECDFSADTRRITVKVPVPQSSA